MDFSPVQLLIVLLIVLVVFGAKRLPEIGRSLGSSAREFKKGISGEETHDAQSSRPGEIGDGDR
ncbi:MAG: twin-arginine translocase TatA/TatE family subunit [Thermoleophilia bacterium]